MAISMKGQKNLLHLVRMRQFFHVFTYSIRHCEGKKLPHKREIESRNLYDIVADP